MITWLAILISSVSHALPTSYPKCLNGPSLEKNLGLIQKATIVGHENRRLLSDEEKRQYAATGIIECPTLDPSKPNPRATIQLAGKKNLVVAHRHIFYDPTNCRPRDISKCEITFPLSNSKQTFRIKPGKAKIGACPNGDDNLDWSAFEIDGTVSGVAPYLIPPKGFVVATGTEVTQLAALANNLQIPIPTVASPSSRYNIQTCFLRDRNIFSNVVVHTNCDTGKGSSGAGQFADVGGKRTMVAINVSESLDLPSGSDYDSRTHYNGSVPLEGEFLNAIHSFLP